MGFEEKPLIDFGAKLREKQGRPNEKHTKKNYIKCDRCGKEMKLGEKVITHDMCLAFFCSYDCMCRHFKIGKLGVVSGEMIDEIEEYEKELEEKSKRFLENKNSLKNPRYL